GRTPKPKTRSDRRELRRHENIGLQPLDRRRLPAQGKSDVTHDIEQETPGNTVDEWGQFKSEEMLGAQHDETPRPVSQDPPADRPELRERRKEPLVTPHEKAERQAGNGSASRRASPQQAAKESRRELCNRSE